MTRCAPAFRVERAHAPEQELEAGLAGGGIALVEGGLAAEPPHVGFDGDGEPARPRSAAEEERVPEAPVEGVGVAVRRVEERPAGGVEVDPRARAGRPDRTRARSRRGCASRGPGSRRRRRSAAAGRGCAPASARPGRCRRTRRRGWPRAARCAGRSPRCRSRGSRSRGPRRTSSRWSSGRRRAASPPRAR